MEGISSLPGVPGGPRGSQEAPIDGNNHLIPHVALLFNFELWFSSESPRPSKNHGMLLDLQLSRRLRFEKAVTSFLISVAHSPKNFR